MFTLKAVSDILNVLKYTFIVFVCLLLFVLLLLLLLLLLFLFFVGGFVGFYFYFFIFYYYYYFFFLGGGVFGVFFLYLFIYLLLLSPFTLAYIELYFTSSYMVLQNQVLFHLMNLLVKKRSHRAVTYLMVKHSIIYKLYIWFIETIYITTMSHILVIF